MGNDLTRAPAIRTCGGNMDKPLGSHDLALAFTDLTDLLLKTVFHARAITALTGLDPWNLNPFFRSKGRIKKADLQVILKITPLPCPPARSRSAPKTEEIFKDIPERRKDIVKTPEPLKTRPLKTCMAVMVEYFRLLRIPQDLICLGRLFETILCLLIPWISVRMVLQGQTAITFFNLLIRGVSIHTQNFIVVSFLIHIALFLRKELAQRALDLQISAGI
jgi:hypothetical protein